jgi:hypothetical protein
MKLRLDRPFASFFLLAICLLCFTFAGHPILRLNHHVSHKNYVLGNLAQYVYYAQTYYTDYSIYLAVLNLNAAKSNMPLEENVISEAISYVARLIIDGIGDTFIKGLVYGALDKGILDIKDVAYVVSANGATKIEDLKVPTPNDISVRLVNTADDLKKSLHKDSQFKYVTSVLSYAPLLGYSIRIRR